MKNILINRKNCSSEGFTTALDEMAEIKELYSGTIIMDRGVEHKIDSGFDEMFKYIIEDLKEPDQYYIEGEMINQTMLRFPKLKEAWGDLSDDQKWVFIQALHYGIRPLINKHGGYKQT